MGRRVFQDHGHLRRRYPATIDRKLARHLQRCSLQASDKQSYPFSQPMPTTGITDRALSTSFITVLPKDEQEIVRAKIKRLMETTHR